MKIAVAQLDVTLMDTARNTKAVVSRLQEAHAQAAELVVLPECVITGYCFSSLDEARPHAQTIPGPATTAVAEHCRQTGQYAVFGLLEQAGDRIFNAAVLVGPTGPVAAYRKVHLPFLGIDQHVAYGDQAFAVHAAGDTNVGMVICYDSAFPESIRTLALNGADLIALPTNFPEGAECMVEHVVNVRAMENAVYFAAANRVGRERGFQFIGRSRICDPGGKTLAQASADAEEILYADINPEQARNKRIVRRPESHVIDRFADRRPEFYEDLVKPHALLPPGRPHGFLP